MIVWNRLTTLIVATSTLLLAMTANSEPSCKTSKVVMKDNIDNNLQIIDDGNAASTSAVEADHSLLGHRLDPTDWTTFREEMHQLLDSCCDRMERYRQKPWIPPPSSLASNVELPIPPTTTTTTTTTSTDDNADATTKFSSSQDDGNGQPLSKVINTLTNHILPHATGNTHPQFFGWVHGAGLPSSIAADLVAATMNSNCGGRHQGANDVEIACINFLTRGAGFSESAGTDAESASTKPFGVLTGGTSQATIYALMAARTKKFGFEVRQKGILHLGPVRVYVSNDAHSCINRAMECLGHGSESVVRIPQREDGSMNTDILRERLMEDGKVGITPLAIVGTAGSVTIGAYDDFDKIADLANEYNTWFHVDAAFGFWTRLSQNPTIRNLTNCIGRADSIALDAHKWPGVDYDCGALLVKDGNHLRDSMRSRPAYLKSSSAGLAGGDVWFTDYSLDLSRGFRALKLWTALKTAGCHAIGQVVTDHCHLASYMAKLVDESSLLEMAHRPRSNIVCFSFQAKDVAAADIATDLQLRGKGVFSTINLRGVDCLRAALVNHRTTEEDIANVIASVEEAVTRRMRSEN